MTNIQFLLVHIGSMNDIKVLGILLGKVCDDEIKLQTEYLLTES